MPLWEHEIGENDKEGEKKGKWFMSKHCQLLRLYNLDFRLPPRCCGNYHTTPRNTPEDRRFHYYIGSIVDELLCKVPRISI